MQDSFNYMAAMQGTHLSYCSFYLAI